MAKAHVIRMDSTGDNMKSRFRRSGSIGMPFVHEDEIPNIKEFFSHPEEDDIWSVEDTQILTVVVPIAPPNTIYDVLHVVKEKHLELLHIESRVQRNAAEGALDLLLQVKLRSDEAERQVVIESLVEHGYKVIEHQQSQPVVLERAVLDDFSDEPNDFTTVQQLADAPWFPRHIDDLDKACKRVLMYGTDLDCDHPGFKDEIYRKRRMMFADIALNHKQSEPIPKVEYTDVENATWRTIYKRLRELHQKHACKEFLDNFELLEKHAGYCEERIPQLQDVSKFLKAKTGFQVRPVAGYLSSRDFLSCLAFRVFACTQYIRHSSDPLYTPEPDCCHELLGHMATFADPDFAQFSQEIGLASLGASEDDVKQLATLYFFTVEFGMCRQGSATKIFGAGLLSSIGELEHAVNDNPKVMTFDPDVVVKQECMITTFQKAYFLTENFEEAQQKIRMFTNNMRRPFVVRYNPYTESIELLNNKRSLTLAVNTLRSDVNLMASALHKFL